MTIVNNRNVSPFPHKYRASRTNRNVSPPSGKSEDPKQKGFFNRPLPGGKTPWDWLQLIGVLLIPLVIFLATKGFNQQQADLAQQQHANDQKIAQQQHDYDSQHALDQQRATILQTYIDNIQDLLLNHNLLGSKPTDDVAILARARTLTALQGLDPERKGLLVKFLYDAKLIGFFGDDGKAYDAIINLKGADLSNAKFNNINHERGADLSEGMPSYVHLSFANLEGTNLTGAILFRVVLSNAKLDRAILSRANLEGTYLDRASLFEATLDGADLYEADLDGANLVKAHLEGTHLDATTLRSANLVEATLRGADLTTADLEGALLEGARLDGAILRDAQNLTQRQLDQVHSCENAILPPRLTCPPPPSL